MAKCEICGEPLRPARSGESLTRCPSTWQERPGLKPLRIYSPCERIAMTLSTLKKLTSAIRNPEMATNVARSVNRLRMQLVRRFEGSGEGKDSEL